MKYKIEYKKGGSLNNQNNITVQFLIQTYNSIENIPSYINKINDNYYSISLNNNDELTYLTNIKNNILSIYFIDIFENNRFSYYNSIDLISLDLIINLIKNILKDIFNKDKPEDFIEFILNNLFFLLNPFKNNNIHEFIRNRNIKIDFSTDTLIRTILNIYYEEQINIYEELEKINSLFIELLNNEKTENEKKLIILLIKTIYISELDDDIILSKEEIGITIAENIFKNIKDVSQLIFMFMLYNSININYEFYVLHNYFSRPLYLNWVTKYFNFITTIGSTDDNEIINNYISSEMSISTLNETFIQNIIFSNDFNQLFNIERLIITKYNNLSNIKNESVNFKNSITNFISCVNFFKIYDKNKIIDLNKFYTYLLLVLYDFTYIYNDNKDFSFFYYVDKIKISDENLDKKEQKELNERLLSPINSIKIEYFDIYFTMIENMFNKYNDLLFSYNNRINENKNGQMLFTYLMTYYLEMNNKIIDCNYEQQCSHDWNQSETNYVDLALNTHLFDKHIKFFNIHDKVFFITLINLILKKFKEIFFRRRTDYIELSTLNENYDKNKDLINYIVGNNDDFKLYDLDKLKDEDGFNDAIQQYEESAIELYLNSAENKYKRDRFIIGDMNYDPNSNAWHDYILDNNNNNLDNNLIQQQITDFEESNIFFLDDAKKIIKFFTKKIHKDVFPKILKKIKQFENEI